MTAEQIERYRRHLVLPEVGMDGQQKLLAARVLCIGVGGLGCPLSLYLAAAGVGTIGLADADVVSPSNLQRQVLFDTRDVGRRKTEVAQARLKALNPDVHVVRHDVLVKSGNVMELLEPYDIVIDGTDNFPTRYCVNDAAVLLKKPNVYGSIFRFEGMVSVFAPHRTIPGSAARGPCYRCLHAKPPAPGTVPSCAEGGVLGVLPGIIGSLQAMETIKLILGIGEPAIGRLLTYSALDMEFRAFKLRADPDCAVCGDAPTIKAPIDYEGFCGMPVLDPASRDETEKHMSGQTTGGSGASGLDERGLPPNYDFRPDWEITPRDVKAKLDAGADFVLIDCRLPHEAQITRIEGATLLPLQELAARHQELDGMQDKQIVVHCRSGGRSLQFAMALRQNGFKDVKSMAGGILLWNTDINPGGPKY